MNDLIPNELGHFNSHEEVEQLNEGLRRDTERMAGERDRKIAAIREGR